MIWRFKSGRQQHDRLQHNQRRQFSGAVVAVALLCIPALPFTAWAAPDDALPPNPLELTEPDPLLPEMVVDRPLNPQEQAVLSTALDELQRQGLDRLQGGDIAGAFEIWNRELRLRRFLGPEQEVESLSRIGAVAWRESETTQVRLITQRLQEIEQAEQEKLPPNYDLLLQIAQAYQSMRARTPAVALYDQLLIQARQNQDKAREQQTLTALAELHLAYFDYTSAASAYEQLLVLARDKGDRTAEEATLKQLAYIYQQNNQPQQAVAIQQQLVDLYKQQNNIVAIPTLKLAMGDSYAAIGRPDLAAPSYQEAFAAARSVQQYAYADDALTRLAVLYQSLDRPDDALIVYQLLLDVQQQSYNTLGMMDTYDKMGKIYAAQGNNGQAVATFRQALQIAQQLNYKVSYFTTQIEQVGQPAAPSAPAAPAQPTAP
ncbi:tetratricopeptide repeat protein [Phormidium tenue FACHB-886]|nr:tetratricopeptide repeat protein [Phormidium tenue FACHB-886]